MSSPTAHICPPDLSWCHSVGPGWHPLVLMLEKIAEMHGFPITQVKEKFGTLRVYHGGAEWFGKLVDECEYASTNICEDCGAPGVTKNVRGWVRTVCEGCLGVKV